MSEAKKLIDRINSEEPAEEAGIDPDVKWNLQNVVGALQRVDVDTIEVGDMVTSIINMANSLMRGKTKDAMKQMDLMMKGIQQDFG